jgi:APA family basic amino acid/polyamine antiporter
VVLTILYGQTRIMYAMSRDGLVPRAFSRTGRRQTPALATAIFGILIAVLAATVPLEVIFELVNIGTLFAFVIVNIGVIVLRGPDRTCSAPSGCRGSRWCRSSAPCSAST